MWKDKGNRCLWDKPYFGSTEVEITLEGYSDIYDVVGNGRKEGKKAGEKAGKERQTKGTPPGKNVHNN